MNSPVQIIDENGDERELTGIEREDWTGMSDPCPECGGQEFNHISTSGGRYGRRDGAVVMRSDFWGVEKPLFTRCRDCRETLYKHPAFDLLFEINGDHDSAHDP
ncbi:hypothetical protein PNQ29_08390 [Halobacterium salinarum]|uniref:hypothetical protein n=1 Tax=Halobacterium salinarum TaxID=2242 RepID=UPI0025530F0A|nr:hypothetical protein [Halobacterium salinarum]MDL0118288.1 hypothetical protein [Halobacterium salinarum]MDL0119747.1 hypothetical protein [Halobacterium salinarum]